MVIRTSMCPRRRKPEARSETMSILSCVTSIFELVKIPEAASHARKATQPRSTTAATASTPSGMTITGVARTTPSTMVAGRTPRTTTASRRRTTASRRRTIATPKPSDDCGKGDTYRNPGEALAKFDFSHGDFGSHGPDHSGDMQGALASMSSDDALEYAIGQMGPADHFDVGHFDVRRTRRTTRTPDAPKRLARQ